MRSLFALVLLCAPAAFAQADANPLSADAKAMWTQIKGLIVRAAEKMPEEDYAFKPSPDVRGFGALVGHVADSYYLICSAEKGERKQVGVEKSKTAKADLVAALKDATAYCDSSVDALTDAKAAEKVKIFNNERTRLAVVFLNNSHTWEHYGNMVTYLRIKGIVPPSSEPRR